MKMTNLPANTQQGGLIIGGQLPAYMQELAAQSSMGSFGDGFSGAIFREAGYLSVKSVIQAE